MIHHMKTFVLLYTIDFYKNYLYNESNHINKGEIYEIFKRRYFKKCKGRKCQVH